MSLTPFSMDEPAPECWFCRKTLTVENCAIVYSAKSNRTLTLGDCCVGQVMSSLIQDYAKMLEKHERVSPKLVYAFPSLRRVRDASTYIATVHEAIASVRDGYDPA
jgi:hypothetical protein